MALPHFAKEATTWGLSYERACRLRYERGLAEARLRPSGYDAAAFATKGLAEPKQATPTTVAAEITTGSLRPVFAFRATTRQPSLRDGSPSRSWRSQRRLVEPGGIEPPTSCMPCKRSPS